MVYVAYSCWCVNAKWRTRLDTDILIILIISIFCQQSKDERYRLPTKNVAPTWYLKMCETFYCPVVRDGTSRLWRRTADVVWRRHSRRRSAIARFATFFEMRISNRNAKSLGDVFVIVFVSKRCSLTLAFNIRIYFPLVRDR